MFYSIIPQNRNYGPKLSFENVDNWICMDLEIDMAYIKPNIKLQMLRKLQTSFY